MAKKASKKTPPRSKKKPAAKKAGKKASKNKASKKPGKATAALDKLKRGHTPPENPGPGATADQKAAYKAEDTLYRVGQRWLEIQDVKLEKARGADERKDKINNLEEAMLSVIREDKHDKPLRELDQCRKWLADKEKKEAELAKFIKAKSEQIKGMEAEFHGMMFGEQQGLPLIDGAAKEVRNLVQAANEKGMTVSVNGTPVNGTDAKALAQKLVDGEARVSVKVGRKARAAKVIRLGLKFDEVWVRFDKPVKVRGADLPEMLVAATKCTALKA